MAVIAGVVIVGEIEWLDDTTPTESIAFARPKSSTFTVPSANRAAWEAALKAGDHGDYTLRILPKANHALLEAKIGNNAEMKSLQRFVPAYPGIVLEWLSKRVNGLGATK